MMAQIEVLLDLGIPYVRLDDYNNLKELYLKQAGLTEAVVAEVADLRDRNESLRANYEDFMKSAMKMAAIHANARAAELEAALDESHRAYIALKEKHDQGGEPLREANRQNMILTARVAELEAALRWRPVTEEPLRPDLYQVAEFLESGVLYEVDHAFWEDGEWQEGQSFTDPSRMTHYRPIPAREAGEEPMP